MRASRPRAPADETMLAMSGVLGGRTAALLLCCALLGAAATGCARIAGGTVAGAAAAKNDAALDVPLSQLRIDPSRFPAGYAAAIVDPVAVDATLRAIDGVPAGAAVTPQECAPPAPGEAAVVTGTGDAGTLTVAVMRVDIPLSERLDQLARCAAFTVDAAGASSTVDVTVLAPPPVGGDSCAVQLATDGASPQTILTLAAQSGDVRVIAAMSAVAGQEPDAATLDGLFNEAVLTARHGGQR